MELIKDFTREDLKALYTQQTGNDFWYGEDYWNWMENLIIDAKNQELLADINEEIETIVKENEQENYDLKVCECEETCKSCSCED